MKKSKSNAVGVNKIKHTILDSLILSAKNCYKYCYGRHIRKAPEYYLNVNIANQVAKEYSSLGYYLEVPFKEIIGESDGRLIKSNIKHKGRLDVALTSINTGKIIYVLEIKRTMKGTSLAKDCLRIAAFLKANKSIKAGFVACVALRPDARGKATKDYLSSRIETIENNFKNSGFIGFSVSTLYEESAAGYHGVTEDKKILFAVFRISKIG